MLYRLTMLLVLSAGCAGSAVAQLPSGYSRDSTVVLPDTLHEVLRGGRFRIIIDRRADSARERELLSVAESLIPPTDSIEAAASRMRSASWVIDFADATHRTGPRWWWREWDGIWLPYALTGEAIAEYVRNVRTLSTSPNPFARHNPGVEHRAFLEYAATVTALPADEGYRAELNVRYYFYCGPRCALSFTHTRVVVFDARGTVVRVEGDRPPHAVAS